MENVQEEQRGVAVINSDSGEILPGVEFSPPQIPIDRLDKILETYDKFQPPALVTNAAERALVSQELIAVVTQKKWATNVQLELTGPVRSLEAKIRSYFKTPLAVLEGAEKALRNRITLYDNEEAARLEQQRRKEQEEANRIAREQTERARAEAERLRQQEADRVTAEKARIQSDAFEAELQGNSLAAKAIVAQVEEVKEEIIPEPEIVAPVQVPSVEIKYKDGTGVRKVKKWRIQDRTKIPAEFWLLDEKKINAMCRSNLNAPSGIEFYEEVGTVVRPGSL